MMKKIKPFLIVISLLMTMFVSIPIVSADDTSGSADWQEDSATVGDTIHADFTWTNAHKHWTGECYACMYIYDPDGTQKASYIEEASYTGSHTLSCTANMEGTWLAEIKVWDGSNWLEYNATLYVGPSGQTSGSADWQEDSATVGDTIHADFTWTNAHYHWTGECYACMYIYDPDGTQKASYIEEASYTGSHTLDCTANMEGTWLAEIKVYDGSNWLEYTDNLTVQEEPDTDPPTPNPSTWDEKPSATGPYSISMKATLATDPSGGVEYYFKETTGHSGGSDSGWQSSRSYTDDGLQPNTQYTYKVKTRDALGNTGSYSTSESATTDPINSAPFVPSNPYPSNDSNNIPIVTSLSWTGGDPDGDDDVTYDIYIGMCPKPDFLPAFEEDLTDTQIDEILLGVDQYYYWKIIATDEHGAQTEGPIWEFSTQTLDQCDPPENSPPNKPVKPILVYPNPIDLHVGDYCIFATQVVDPDGDNVNIYWNMDAGIDKSVDFELLNVTCNETHGIFYKWDKPPGQHYIQVIATDIFGEASLWSYVLPIYVFVAPNNNPPNNASIPAGDDEGFVDQPHTYTTYAVDPDGDKIKYQWDFGDGTITSWDDVSWVESGYEVSYSHIWNSTGYYDVKARVKDLNGAVTPWSDYKRVSMVKKDSATIFNCLDFAGGIYGDIFDNFPGQGRLGYANGATGVFVTGAYGGFPFGHSWSTACQGVEFYVGRTKSLTIDAELSFISGTEFVLPAYTWLQKVIKVDGFYEPEKEHKEWINNIGTVEDLQALCTGAIALLGSVAYQPSGPITLFDLTKTTLWTNQYLQQARYATQSADDILSAFGSVSRMGNAAKESYITLWETVQKTGGVMVPGASSTGTSTTVTVKATVGSQPTSTFGPLWLILTAALEIWTLYQLMSHWQVDTLLEKFEKTGQAYTEHISKTFTFDEGDHNVWAGMQSDAEGFLFFFGFAYAAGLVKSITIDGIASPETPTLDYPDKMSAETPIEFIPFCIDQNGDDVQYFIDWGDGTNMTTKFFESGEEGQAIHIYESSGAYTITIKSKDCDKMESEPATYDIFINAKNNENIQSSQQSTIPTTTFFTPFNNIHQSLFFLINGQQSTQQSQSAPSTTGQNTPSDTQSSQQQSNNPQNNQQSISSNQRPKNTLFLRLLEQFPNSFPMLRQLLGL